MVKLNWDNKSDINNNIEDFKKKYINYFEKINFTSESKSLTRKNTTNWTNKLFWGENKEVLYHLLNNFENKIDLIYIDPPFYSGTNYEIRVEDGEESYDDVAYYDHWDKDLDSYLQMLYERLILIKKLLSKKGLVFIHLDWHASHYIRLILDEIFGQNRFVNNIIWYYYNKYSAGKKNLPRAHDNILVYSKSKNYTLNELRIPRKKPIKQLKRVMVDGVLKNAKDENGHVIYRVVSDKKLDDVWKIPCMQPASKEWTGFPTQKHHKLLERIIKLGSNEGDIIADFFCGSGTTLLVAEKIKRKWIGCDISKFAIFLTRNRIKNYHKDFNEVNHPFEIYTDLNEKKINTIKSGFFEKKLIIKRKN